MLEEAGHVLLVAGETVEGLGYDGVEFAGAGVLQEFLVSGPEPAGPAAGGIAIRGNQFPALALDPLPTDPDLILDGGLALKVSGVSGVDHGAHGCLQFVKRGLLDGQVGAVWVRRRLRVWRRAMFAGVGRSMPHAADWQLAIDL